MEEKQLEGNLIKVARTLHAKFDVQNAKDATRESDQPHEILMTRSKRGRQEEHSDMDNLTRSMQRLTFSGKDPRLMGWQGDDPLIIQGSIKDVTTHRVYIDTDSLADIIYEHCFCLLPNRWKARLKPATGRLTGFT